MRSGTTTEDVRNQVHRIGDIHTTAAVGITKANRFRSRAAAKDVADQEHSIGNIDTARTIGITALADSGREVLPESLFDLEIGRRAGASGSLTDSSGQAEIDRRTFGTPPLKLPATLCVHQRGGIRGYLRSDSPLEPRSLIFVLVEKATSRCCQQMHHMNRRPVAAQQPKLLMSDSLFPSGLA